MGCTASTDVGARGKVLVTGVTGYLGSSVALAFLKDGNFVVKGTVRDPSNQTKLEPLKKGYGEKLFAKLELAKADLLDADSID
jgi:nucleoside-diphosphate-sugar epimerase